MPADYASIGEALAAASDGDTILVGPGTWSESVLVTKRVTIRSLTGNPADTIIDPVGPGSSVRVAADDVTIESLTVAGSDFAGIYAEGTAGLTLREVVATNNPYGVYLTGSPRALIEDCTITQNAATGVALYNGSHDATVRTSSLLGNDYGIYELVPTVPRSRPAPSTRTSTGCSSTSPTTTPCAAPASRRTRMRVLPAYFGSSGNTFTDCEFFQNGFGAYVYASGANTFFDCTLDNDYYGIYLDSSVGTVVDSCTVTGNPYAGLAVYFGSTDTQVRDSDLSGNGFGAYVFSS